MNWPFGDTALLREQVEAAEARALVAEAALEAERSLTAERRGQLASAHAERLRVIDAAAAERKEHRQAERHLVSMWLRSQRSNPLPPTAEEKAQAKIEAEEEKEKPPVLSDVQTAMRDANRLDAARHNVSQEEADELFMKNLSRLTPE